MSRVKSTICLIMVMCTICFVGCGENQMVGSWVIESFEEEGGATVKAELLMEILDIDSLEQLLSMEIKSDNTLVAISGGDTLTGTWGEKSGVLEMTIDGDTVEPTVKGDKLIVPDFNGDIMIFKRK